MGKTRKAKTTVINAVAQMMATFQKCDTTLDFSESPAAIEAVTFNLGLIQDAFCEDDDTVFTADEWVALITVGLKESNYG